MDIKQWLGEENKLGQDIWERKYQYKGESFDEWLNRVSNGNEELKQLIIDKKFLFGGRILSNRGLHKKGKKVTYSNCYVIPQVEDNIESIYDSCSKLARTFSYGGGCGLDISKLRPKGAKVYNASEFTTGACSFMETFSQVTETIGMSGRRGALMLSIDCNHPDLEEFINIKTDLNKVTKANISVKITDDFMKAVELDGDWKLTFITERDEVIEKTVKAKEIFMNLCENNWNFAEPGILYWDRIENYNIVSEDSDFKYSGVNPCLVGDTLIQTVEGAKPIKELVGTKPYVYCMDKDGKLVIKQASKVWKTREDAELVEIDFGRGKLICTPDHLILTRNRGWVKAIELRPNIDIVNGFKYINITQDGKAWTIKKVTILNYKEDVYDMTVDELHNFIANNIVVHNCAEEPLPAGGSCLLGSFNLSAYVKNGGFDYNEFKHDIPIVVKAMNDVLDEGLPLHPLQIQKDTVRDWRQIGIGIMGLGDMLVKMGLTYGEEDSIKECDKIGFTLANESLKSSALLAKELGSYLKYNISVLNSQFVLNNTDSNTYELITQYGLRNSQILTTAPTGTLSTMLGITGGIEPIFEKFYTRKTESLHGEDVYYKVYTPIVKKYIEQHDCLEEDLPKYFVTAMDLNPINRVKMQSVWQKHIDASISSTVNLPKESTVQDVYEVYMEAWKQGCKGMTIYRSGCAREGILTTTEKEEVKELQRGKWKSLAKDTYYIKKNLTIGCGKLKLFIGYSPSEEAIQDLYIIKNGNGGCTRNLQALAISMSAVLRLGGTLDNLEKAFRGIDPCNSFVSARAKGKELSKGTYCGSAILNCVKDLLKEISNENKKEIKIVKEKENTKKVNIKDTLTEQEKLDKGLCPTCGDKLERIGGCMQCKTCGFSRCD